MHITSILLAIHCSAVQVLYKCQSSDARTSRSKILLLPIISVMLLSGFNSSATAIEVAATPYVCEVYDPADLSRNYAYRNPLIEATENLSNGSIDEAIDTFLDVIHNTKEGTLQNSVARNNLVCAYIKQANTTDSGSCGLVIRSAMEERKELISLETALDLDGLPSIPYCADFDLNIIPKGVPYPVRASFFLNNESKYRKAILDNLNSLRYLNTDDTYSAMSLDLERGKILLRGMPKHGVYCYAISYLDTRLSPPILGAAHISGNEQDQYVLGEVNLFDLGSVWRLYESKETRPIYELIIVDRLEGLEEKKVTTITTLSDNKKHTIELTSESNPIDSREIEYDGASDIRVHIETEITLADANKTTIKTEGFDTLNSMDIGQIFVVGESQGDIALLETTCDDYTKAEAGDSTFGFNFIATDSTVNGTVESLSGDIWVINGNEGDIVEIAMHSDDMIPVVELGLPGKKPFKGAGYNSRSSEARIEYTLPETGAYHIATKARYQEGQEIDIGHFILTVKKRASKQSDRMKSTDETPVQFQVRDDLGSPQIWEKIDITISGNTINAGDSKRVEIDRDKRRDTATLTVSEENVYCYHLKGEVQYAGEGAPFKPEGSGIIYVKDGKRFDLYISSPYSYARYSMKDMSWRENTFVIFDDFTGTNQDKEIFIDIGNNGTKDYTLNRMNPVQEIPVTYEDIALSVNMPATLGTAARGIEEMPRAGDILTVNTINSSASFRELTCTAYGMLE